MNPSNESITIVSGMPRSGTSMMMQMLSAAGMPLLVDGLRRADDDNTEGYFEYEPVKKLKQDSAWVAEARGKVVKVIYMLLYDLPPQFTYRVIFLRRELDEVLASQRKMLERRGEEGATVPAAKLKSIFTDQLNKVEAWLSDRSELDVLYVDHRRIIDDPLAEARRVSEFLDSALDEHAMAAAVNPTLYRQRSGR